MAGALAELRRRSVFRVAGLYLVVAWLLLQAAGLLEEALRLPGWFDGMVTALVALGFPIALVVAWAFELTPEGLARTAASDPVAEARTRWTDAAIAAGLVAVAALIGVDRFARPGVSAVAGPVAVAVLPFVDLSPDGDQAYFSEGLAEEILNVLAREDSLRVAGRTSSFAFEGKGADVKAIGRTLGVSHVLEGSVRKSGSRIRVNAQLVRTDTGFPVFSERYDRELDEVFAVQDDLSRRIARALRIRLDPSGTHPDIPVSAYEAFLAARDAVHTRRRSELERAERLLSEVLAEAPGFAPAHALVATVTVLLCKTPSTYGTRNLAVELPRARRAADRALELDRELADAHAVLGLVLSVTPEDDGDPRVPLRRALELNPNHTSAWVWLIQSSKPSLEAMAEIEGILERDPGFLPAVALVTKHALRRGEFDRARTIIHRAAGVPGTDVQIDGLRAFLAHARSDLVEAVRLARLAAERDAGANQLLATILLDLGEFERAFELGDPTTRVMSRMATGDLEGAAELLAAWARDPSLVAIGVRLALRMGEPAAGVARFEEVYGPLEDISGLERLQQPRAPLLPVVAQAYRRVGREEAAERGLALADELIEAGRALGHQDAPDQTVLRSEVALARGRIDEGVAELEALVERGFASASSQSFVLGDALPPATFQRIDRALRARVDEARRVLGWAPLPPRDPT